MAHYGGYIAFGKLVGYHRGLWIFITQSSLIICYQRKIIPPLARHLQLDNTHTVRSFNTIIHHIFLNNNIYSRITDIHKLEVYLLPNNHARAFKRPDNLVVN